MKCLMCEGDIDPMYKNRKFCSPFCKTMFKYMTTATENILHIAYEYFPKEYLEERKRNFEELSRIWGDPEVIISIKNLSCCNILKQHAFDLKDDPERLPTDYIKKLSQCPCEKEIEK